jgi:hypothetical protein
LARAIRSFRIGKQTYYNGLHVLANAWSGDVATILLIVSDMFEDAKVDPNTVNRIPNEVQHNAIVRVSKGLRGHVQGYAPFGKEMNNVLTIFGDLANRLLVDHKARLRKARDGKHKSDINRKYRLEWTMPEGANINSELLRLDRTGDCYRLYTELIRRAIFHENLQSRGKEGEGRRTVRLQIRSSLLPSFGTSLVHENHIKIDKTEDFVEFLTQTRRWADGVIARYSTPATLIGFDLFGEPHD